MSFASANQTVVLAEKQNHKAQQILGYSLYLCWQTVPVCASVCLRGASHSVTSTLPPASQDRKKHVLPTPWGAGGEQVGGDVSMEANIHLAVDWC